MTPRACVAHQLFRATGGLSAPVRQAAFPAATLVQVANESSQHNVAQGSETHFKVVVVSDEFKGQLPLDRHRVINGLLKAEFDAGLHALSIVAKTQVGV